MTNTGHLNNYDETRFCPYQRVSRLQYILSSKEKKKDEMFYKAKWNNAEAGFYQLYGIQVRSKMIILNQNMSR